MKQVKLCSAMVVAIALLSSQATASMVQLSNNKLINNDMKTCYDKLNELKKYDQKKFNSLNKHLMMLVQSQASLITSEKYASPEAMSYIKSQQTKSINYTCDQISQKLDEALIKKAMTSL